MEQRDLTLDGCGRAHDTASVVMLFNLLHIDEPVDLLREAHRVLHPGGFVGVTHRNVAANTPRVSPLEIRPRPE